MHRRPPPPYSTPRRHHAATTQGGGRGGREEGEGEGRRAAAACSAFRSQLQRPHLHSSMPHGHHSAILAQPTNHLMQSNTTCAEAFFREHYKSRENSALYSGHHALTTPLTCPCTHGSQAPLPVGGLEHLLNERKSAEYNTVPLDNLRFVPSSCKTLPPKILLTTSPVACAVVESNDRFTHHIGRDEQGKLLFSRSASNGGIFCSDSGMDVMLLFCTRLGGIK